MPFSAAEIARHLQGEVLGDGQVTLSSLAPADTAKPGDLTFADSDEYFARADQSAASAIIAGGTLTSATKVLIRVKNPRVAFARALPLFFPEPKLATTVHPSAVVAASAQVAPSAHVGPGCVIGERTKIGARVILRGGNHIGDDCKIGEDTQLFPNAVVYAHTEIGQRVRIHANAVVGSDGYGYVFDQGIHRKVLQVGNVIIGDDVEIGACVTVDRAALGSTIIGKGTKIGNLSQVAHNVQIGEHCLLLGQVAVSGSTKLGNYVILAGQVGLAGHLTIGNQVTVGAQSGVMHNIPDGEKWLWSPAQPDRQVKRQMIALQYLPELLRRVSALEKKAKGDENAAG